VRLALLVVGATLTACQTTTSATQVTADAADADAAAALDVEAFLLRLNPVGPRGDVLYMGASEGCHYVAANVDVPHLMAAINRTEPTSCAPLSDPAWGECPFGAVYATKDRSDCICRATGKPVKKMTCPK
jgi:hypothetical protein